MTHWGTFSSSTAMGHTYRGEPEWTRRVWMEADIRFARTMRWTWLVQIPEYRKADQAYSG
jgi:hypothetical protein